MTEKRADYNPEIPADIFENSEISQDLEENSLDLVEADFVLDDKALQWAENYLGHFDPTRATRNVYPEVEGSSAKGRAMLQNRHIMAYLKERVREKALQADEVLAQLAEIATGSIEDFIALPDGVMTPFFDLQKAKEAGKLHLIKRIRYVDKGPGSRGSGIEIELYDKMEALRMIGQALGMFREQEERVGEFIIKVVRE